jgi:vitamin B12 transport system substrate-binding protein
VNLLTKLAILLLLTYGCELLADESHKQQLRLIVLAPHSVEALFELGAGGQIIGVTEHADFPEQAKALPRIGNYAGLQIERIVQMAPDWVIAWQSGNSAADLARLEKLGLRIFYSQPQKLEDVAKELLRLGELTGRQTKAAKVTKQYNQRLEAIRKQYQNVPPVSVFYELWSRPLRTVAANAWPQQHIDLCGATNPFANSAQDYPQVSLETVLASRPQVLVQPVSQAVKEKHTHDTSLKAQALHWQNWPTLPAVENAFIIHPNADKLHRMTSRTLDELVYLCERIDQARQFYYP